MADAARQRPGGRTARTRSAVLGAVLAELSAHGYAALTIEDVAQRAGVHKTTVYRRWGTKQALVADAAEAVASTTVDLPDTGDAAEDLRLFARSVLATITGADGGTVVQALFSGASDSPELREVLSRFWTTRLAQVRPLVQRAIDRGQLPSGTDPDEVIKQVGAPLYYRLLVTAEPLTVQVADLAAAAAHAAACAGVFVAPS